MNRPGQSSRAVLPNSKLKLHFHPLRYYLAAAPVATHTALKREVATLGLAGSGKTLSSRLLLLSLHYRTASPTAQPVRLQY
jgi:hypothetical protein